MPRLNFGAFLAPHHPIGEHPMLQFRRDLDLVEHLDKLGYDEFWCGEHHSSGWEMIASPEMFLAAAGERSKRIKLGTGVVSLPYHHPFNVAQRMVQLDYMTGGRAIFGSGPGALASDAHTLGIDPMLLRDRQDEAIGVIRRLFRGERVTYKTDWFTLQDAALQLLPLQEEMPFAVASQISPSGMTLAGKHGIGIISIGSLSDEGLNALPTQWGFAEDRGRQARPDRRPQELARAAELAHRRDAREGPRRGPRRPAAPPQRVHHRHPAAARARGPSRPPTRRWTRPPSAPARPPPSARPDDLVARIKSVLDDLAAASAPSSASCTTGPTRRTRCAAGTWWRATWCRRSTATWPSLRKSREFVANNREYFNRAREAVMAKITENEAAAAALAVTKSPLLAASAGNVPDLDQARAALKPR